MEKRVCRQEPIDWTVGILDANGRPVGTGFFVSADGKIVTWAHVVRDAGVAVDSDEAEVGICFARPNGDEQEGKARIAGRIQQGEDDVILLRVEGDKASRGPEAVAVLGRAEQSELHGFSCYGYCHVGDKPESGGFGRIVKVLPHSSKSDGRAGWLQLEASQIDQGMSGAAVLDVSRNLVVGIIRQTFYPGLSTKHRDTAWAIDAQILMDAPFSVSVRDDPLDLRAGPVPCVESEPAQPSRQSGALLNSAPAVPPHWVGRTDMLRRIAADWDSSERRVTGLIGFAGEGKTSLAREAVEELMHHSESLRPKGIFWWTFTDPPDVDGFFESAVAFMQGCSTAETENRSTTGKIHALAGMLDRGRYLFVIDGLEYLQYQEGSRFGQLANNDIREFLSYFANPYHRSYCLITSRVPVLDLARFETYSSLDVDRLSTPDGRGLLRQMGVHGTNRQLDDVVEKWGGHAWTLVMLANHIMEWCGGDIGLVDELVTPLADESMHDRIHRLLQCYDQHLAPEEKALLLVSSAFRVPFDRAAVLLALGSPEGNGSMTAPLAALDDAQFDDLLRHLVGSHLLSVDESGCRYRIHRLVQAHFADDLDRQDRCAVRTLHNQIKNYYLDLVDDLPKPPTLESLSPLVEAVHHACQAGRYEEAYDIYWSRISQGEARVLRHVLGAGETMLAVASGFFPRGDLSLDPLISGLAQSSDLLNEIGLALLSLGRLSQSEDYFVRSNELDICRDDMAEASIGLQNLAVLHVDLGHLARARCLAQTALIYAMDANNEVQKQCSRVCLAWIAHLTGDQVTDADFQWQGGVPETKDGDTLHSYTLCLLWYVEHLLKLGDFAKAEETLRADAAICEQHSWPDRMSKCCRLYGLLFAGKGLADEARQHLDRAVWHARATSEQEVLIEALLARGRWYGRYMRNYREAIGNLMEAFEHARSGGYRLYEADVRIALGWTQPLDGEDERAKANAQHAKDMSEQMGYHWGIVDADEVLESLRS